LADIAVYDGAGKKWYLLQTTAGLSIRNFGATGAIPLPADYDGDKVCDLGIYVPGSATWFLGQSTVGFETFVLGSPNSIPFTTVP
jgi:hypothetical protein